MSKKSTIWISRDLRGKSRKELYFWNKKPKWDHTECTYEGNEGEKICSLIRSCDDLCEILLALGIAVNDSCVDDCRGGLQLGQLVELSVVRIVSEGIPLATKAKALRSKMDKRGAKVPRREILALLDELSVVVVDVDVDEDEDEDDEDEDDNSFSG